MKNHYSIWNCILVILGLLLSTSCSEKNIEQENDLLPKLIQLESEILQGSIDTVNISKEIINTELVKKIEKLKNSQNETDFNNTLLEISTLTDNQSKKGIAKPVEFTKAELLILESIKRSIKISNISTIAIVDYYINEVPCLNVNNYDLVNCLSSLTIYKDLMLYFDTDNLEKENLPLILSNNSKSVEDWKKICPYRTCFDCCMKEKLEDIEEGNLVDWIQFLICVACETTWMASSCGYDCIFN